MHTRMTDILIKTGRYSLRIAVVRVTPSGEADSHRCCALFNPAHRDDEHALILQYCQTLGGEGSPCSQPQSPAQILQAVEREERGELERVIARLEEEQRYSRVSQVVFCSRIYIYLFFFFLFSSTLVMGIFGVSHNTTYTHFGGRILRHTRHAGREPHFLDAGFSPAKRVAPFRLCIHRK